MQVRSARRRRRRRTLILALAFIAGLGLALYLWLLAGLPSPADLEARASAPGNLVYDRNGRLLYEMPPPGGGRHTPVSLEEVPESLIQATLAAEDARFYEHPGVDPVAILRALWQNLRYGRTLSGASTIPQQLARNVLLSPEERQQQTLRRKLREAILAWQLSRRYNKEELLELYLNETYYGNMAYGVEAAAQAYFGKSVGELDLAEAALLAGLPQAPTRYNPLENLPAARERQATVLNLMVRQGYISPEEADLAAKEPLHFAASPFLIRAPHFVMYVRTLLEEELGRERLEQGGLRIYTSLDLDLYDAALEIVRTRLALLATCNGWPDCPPGGHNVHNAAVVALDPRTGQVLAMVGSPDYFSAAIDGAVNGSTALRQPGSAIKPITYAAAFARGDLTPATMMLDLRTAFVTREGEPYVPINYDLLYHGPVRLRQALASSYNLIAVRVLDQIGIETMIGLARRMGLTTFDDLDRLGLAVTLGGGEVRLLELATAYAVFANGGRAVRPVTVLRVEDEAGDLLWEAPPALGGRVLDERVAYLITDILSDDMARLPAFGEGSVLRLSRPAAAKTGTTTDFRDNWTVGYTPDLVVGVWVGNADNEPMFDISGISGAAPIWHDLMELALRSRPPAAFERPEGLVEVEVCALSGLRPNPDCPYRVRELFLAGTEPEQTCTLHQRIAVDRCTGRRATAETPPECLEERVYTLLPPEAQEWARRHGIPQPPPAGPEETVAAGPALPSHLQDATPLVLSEPDEGAVYQLDPSLPRDVQRIRVAARPGSGASPVEVTLFVDGQPLAHFRRPPYRAFWPLEEGEHTFWAEGVDVEGALISSNRVRIRVRPFSLEGRMSP